MARKVRVGDLYKSGTDEVKITKLYLPGNIDVIYVTGNMLGYTSHFSTACNDTLVPCWEFVSGEVLNRKHAISNMLLQSS